jgi:hypothetical protein
MLPIAYCGNCAKEEALHGMYIGEDKKGSIHSGKNSTKSNSKVFLVAKNHTQSEQLGTLGTKT